MASNGCRRLGLKGFKGEHFKHVRLTLHGPVNAKQHAKAGTMATAHTRISPLIDRQKHRLDQHLDSWQSHLPTWAERSLRWLRKPAVRWVRIPVGVLLVAGGLLALLPVFGLWMIPLGLLLLALDLPFLRLPMRRAIVWTKRQTRGLRRRYRRARG